MASAAIILLPMEAWIGILNCCRGMSSFNFVTSARPILYALSWCTIDARGSATCTARQGGSFIHQEILQREHKTQDPQDTIRSWSLVRTSIKDLDRITKLLRTS